MNVQYWAPLKYPSVTKTRHWIWHFIERHLPNISLVLMVMTLFAAILYPTVVYLVPSGSTGVLWKRFGGGTILTPTNVMYEGIHFVWPWNQVFIYDLRLQTATETYNAISSDGVNLNASITVRFQLVREGVPRLHQAVGPDYLHLLLLPEVGNRVREIIAQHTSEAVYSTERVQIQEEMFREIQDKLGNDLPALGRNPSESIVIYDVLILGIDLPPAIIAQINRKTAQYYITQEYNFRIAREQKEAQRKRIEAEGIRDFQAIVGHGISESYLRWRGVDATLQLAQSPNSKVVVIGSGKDGLPIILGNSDSSPSSPSSPASPAAPPDSLEQVLLPEAVESSPPLPDSTALTAPIPNAASELAHSPSAVATQLRDAAKPAGVNVPHDETPAANLQTPSAATPDVPHALVPPQSPPTRADTTSGAIQAPAKRADAASDAVQSPAQPKP